MSEREELISLCTRIEIGANQVMQKDYVTGLMDLCDYNEAEYAVDIGTNSGTSCLSLACSMHLRGKPTSRVTTIDIHQGRWMSTMARVDQLFAQHGMDITKIERLEKDFKQVPAARMVKRSRMAIFFDIHDLEDGSGVPNSVGFVRDWLPLINNGVVGVHDINRCEEDWQRPAHWGTVCSADVVQSSVNGFWYRGFGEVRTIIEYLNSYEVAPREIPGTSIIWFEVKEGYPQ